MLNVTSMDKVLNSVYLDAVSVCLNERTSAFYNKVTKSAANVYGKEIVAPCRFGINGGVACSQETADLPDCSPSSMITLRAPLVNIYGNLELSDKILRLNDGGAAMIDVLNYEIDSLLESAKYNMRRMLFQSGDGVLATMTAAGAGNQTISVNHTRNIVEGMVIDIMNGNNVALAKAKVTYVNNTAKTVKLDVSVATTIAAGCNLTVSGSHKCEIYGLPYIYSDGGSVLYGNTRSLVSFALPSEYTDTEVTPSVLQSVIDGLEEKGSQGTNMIISSYAMRRKYFDSMNALRLNVETVTDGDFKAPAYNGLPIYAEPFVDDNTMYFINTDDYMLAQIADWSWVEGSTHDILRPVPGKAAYTATLVKYCNLICRKPKGQARLVLTTD